MKTVDDYRKNILGIRLKGLESLAQASNIHSPLAESVGANIAFFADPNDLELQKPMVDKILSLFQTTPTIISSIPGADFTAEILFIFGANKAAKEQIKAKESFVFKSFSEISQNNDLKRDLWEKLKKYT